MMLTPHNEDMLTALVTAFVATIVFVAFMAQMGWLK